MIQKRLNLNLQDGEPPIIHPQISYDIRGRCFSLALHETLMRRHPSGTLEPAAAEKVEVDPTQTIYTFYLRPQQWSNGEPVTAQHFAKAWRHALDPKSLCARADLFYIIKNAQRVKKGELPPDAVKISTPDQKTLVVELEHPAPYFLDLVAGSVFAPLYEASDKSPVYFNGPFMIKERVHDQRLVFQKNPFYWDRDSVYFEEICFTLVKDQMTALSMFERGEIDAIGEPLTTVPRDTIPSFMKSGRLKKKLVTRIFYLFMNVDTYPLHVKSLRKALSLSIDRHALTQYLLFEETPVRSLVPKTITTVNEEELGNGEDANALLDQALSELQLTRETFPKLVFRYCAVDKRFAEFLQEEWRKKLGIKIDIVGSDWNTHFADVKQKNYQIGSMYMAAFYQDPLFYFDLFRDKDSFCNYTGWESPGFKSLLTTIEREIDPKKRHQLLQQAEKQLFDEMPAIPLYTQTICYLTREDLDLFLTDSGLCDLKWAKIYDHAQLRRQ